MTVVTKAGIASPVLPKQSVEVEPLGGEVVVRGLLLVELLGVQQRIAALRQAMLPALAAPEAVPVEAAGLPIAVFLE